MNTANKNRYLNYLFGPRFPGVKRIFVLLQFRNKTDKEVHTDHYLSKMEIKDYNVMIDGRNFFNKPVKKDLRTDDNIRKIATGQGDDYTNGFLLDNINFTEHYKLIVIDLSKQQKLDADPKGIQQINFTGNLESNAAIFFTIKEVKEIVFTFFKRKS